MPEDINQGATPAPEPVTGQEPATNSIQTQAVDDKVAESAEELARRLRNKTEEAERLHKKLEKFEAEEAERKKAAMSETDRLKTELADALKTANELKTRQAQRDAAEKIGLPLSFADRLKGVTPEELEADARALLESMPKAAPKPKPGPASAPADGLPQTTTDDERRKFLFG